MKKRIATAFAAGALFINSALPVLATTTLEISGNGTQSVNEVGVGLTQTTTVVQNNSAEINNFVSATANSGNNDADNNTSGDVSIDTGSATTEVDISNDVNSNVAEVDCCDTGDVEVKISENGSKTENTVGLGKTNVTQVFQTNHADVMNAVMASSDSGNNDADGNTGGTVSIDTGAAKVDVDIANSANSNSAYVGGDSGTGTLSARIIGNGTESVNSIGLGLTSAVVVDQINDAHLMNFVLANANSGWNDADDNTGDETSINTGMAKTKVGITNTANFNWADVDCGCLLGATAKIAGNGKKSVNHIGAGLTDSLVLFQDNFWTSNGVGCSPKDGCEDGDDFVLASADSGWNDIDGSTGSADGDPMIDTGSATTEVELTNTGNSNHYGDPTPSGSGPGGINVPGFSFNFNLSFSLSDLLAALGA